MPNKQRTRANKGMGSIRQRADGRWEGRYTAPSGAQKSVYGKTEKEVTTRLKKQLHDIDIGIWREPSRITVNDWLTVWLRDYQGHTTGRTVTSYTTTINNYIRPVIGKYHMTTLKTPHIMGILSAMQQRKLSASTQRQTIILVSSIMRAAVAAGIINSNPASDVKIPKRTTEPFQIVDRQKIPAFIKAANETTFPNELLLMLYTGLRVGELRGLRWSDWNDSTLKVERQLYAHAHNTGFGKPKHGEIRTIELPAEARTVLQQQRIRQAEQRLAAGNKWRETEISSGLIFRQRLGQPHTNVSLARAVKDVGNAIGIPGLHPHDLRHSYAVAAIRSGADIKTVQHNMGHRSASVTLDTYAAYTTDAGKIGAEKLSEYLKNGQ